MGAEGGQFLAQGGGAGGVGAPAARQQEPGDAVAGDEVAGGAGAEGAGASGHQDGAPTGDTERVGVLRAVLGRGRGQLGEAADEDLSVADGGLRLVDGEDGLQGKRGARFDVDQTEFGGVLGLGGADHAPHRGPGQVGGGVAGTGGHDAACDEDQPGARRAGAVQPLLEEGEGGAGRLVGGGDRVLAAVGDGHEDLGARLGDLVEAGQDGAGAERVGAEGDPGASGGGPGGFGGDPVDAEEGGAVGSGLEQAGRPGGPQGQRLDRQHGPAGGVDGGDADGVLTGLGDTDPEPGGPGGVQGDAGPGERQESLVGVLQLDVLHGVEGGGEQGGVEAEEGGVVGAGGQSDFGEDLVVPGPHGTQPLEERAVLGALVEAVQVDGGGVGGGPGALAEGDLACSGDQDAGGVLGPGLVVGGVLGPGVDGERAAAGRVGGTDADLHGGGASQVEGERGGEGQFLDAAAAGLVARADGEFEEGRGGEEDEAAHDVVGEPGVGAQAHAPGQQDALRTGEGDRGTEQGVLGRGEPGAGDVGGVGERARPVAAVLPGVRGQVLRRSAQRVDQFGDGGGTHQDGQPDALVGGFEDGGHLRDSGVVVEHADLVVGELFAGESQVLGGDEVVHGHKPSTGGRRRKGRAAGGLGALRGGAATEGVRPVPGRGRPGGCGRTRHERSREGVVPSPGPREGASGSPGRARWRAGARLGRDRLACPIARRGWCPRRGPECSGDRRAHGSNILRGGRRVGSVLTGPTQTLSCGMPKNDDLGGFRGEISPFRTPVPRRLPWKRLLPVSSRPWASDHPGPSRARRASQPRERVIRSRGRPTVWRWWRYNSGSSGVSSTSTSTSGSGVPAATSRVCTWARQKP